MVTTPAAANSTRIESRLLADLTADAIAHFAPENREWLKKSSTRFAVYTRVLLTSAGFRCVLLYRLGFFARRNLPWLGRLVSGVLFWIQRHWYGCAIASTADIGGGLILPHPTGIVIGAGVVIGCRTWIFQHVTIGGSPGKTGMPRVGSDSRILTGAVIAGPVTLGDHVVVAANTVVSFDVASHSIVRAARPVVSLFDGSDTGGSSDVKAINSGSLIE